MDIFIRNEAEEVRLVMDCGNVFIVRGLSPVTMPMVKFECQYDTTGCTFDSLGQFVFSDVLGLDVRLHAGHVDHSRRCLPWI